MSRKLIIPNNSKIFIEFNYFIKIFRENLKEENTIEIVKALNEVNLVLCNISNNEIKYYFNAIYDFSKFFFIKYFKNEEIVKLIYFNWNKKLPFILEKGNEIGKIFNDLELFEEYKELDKNEKEKLDILIDDILEDSDFKNIKIFYSTGEEIELFLNSFFDDLEDEEVFEKEYQEMVFKGHMTKLFLNGGYLVITYIDYDNLQIKSAFKVYSKKIISLEFIEYKGFEKEKFLEYINKEEFEEKVKEFDELFKNVFYLKSVLKF